jgi:hypothetical protein
LRRVIDADSDEARVRFPVIDTEALAKEAEKAPLTTDAEADPKDGLYPCSFEGCERRLASIRGRRNHERSHTPR